mmetsp:Transcript_3840/g.5776  ORF Transcript_3840/g.5776 Transcript_3840/m.5776 type:complete len:168 (-) Transcript_3840:191-694(-)
MVINVRNNLLVITLLIAIASMAMTASAMSTEEIIKLFQTYDVDEDEAPDCQPESFHAHICPKDETIPCGDISKIEEHCASIIGTEHAAAVKATETGQGKNAMEGCVKYVGFHVFDKDHMACCESDTCEDWIDQQFEMMDIEDVPEYDDDDGEDDDDVYYSEHHHSEF